MRNLAMILGGAAVVGAGLFFMNGQEPEATVAPQGVLGAPQGGVALQTQPAVERSEVTKSFEEKGYAVGDVILGDPDAPVTLIEYASLTCPHCASFHNDELPEIMEKYIDTGKANLIVREAYFDGTGLYASVIARCGGPERYHAFLDAFFKNHRQWIVSNVPNDNLPHMRRIARLGGLSNERINECLTDRAFQERLLADYSENFQKDEIRATPTFIIGNTKLRGAHSASAIGEEIESRLPQ